MPISRKPSNSNLSDPRRHNLDPDFGFYFTHLGEFWFKFIGFIALSGLLDAAAQITDSTFLKFVSASSVFILSMWCIAQTMRMYHFLKIPGDFIRAWLIKHIFNQVRSEFWILFVIAYPAWVNYFIKVLGNAFVGIG